MTTNALEDNSEIVKTLKLFGDAKTSELLVRKASGESGVLEIATAYNPLSADIAISGLMDILRYPEAKDVPAYQIAEVIASRMKISMEEYLQFISTTYVEASQTYWGNLYIGVYTSGVCPQIPLVLLARIDSDIPESKGTVETTIFCIYAFFCDLRFMRTAAEESLKVFLSEAMEENREPELEEIEDMKLYLQQSAATYTLEKLLPILPEVLADESSAQRGWKSTGNFTPRTDKAQLH